MASKLFLLEFHIGTIEFDASFEPIPKQEEILINIKFADVSINIDPDDFPFEKNVDKHSKMLYNMGKSYMFTSTPKEFIHHLKNEYLEVSLRIHQKTMASVFVPWPNNFPELVQLFENIGVVKPAEYRDVEQLSSIRGETICQIDLSVRLSCFGDSVETQYQAKVVGNQNEYILKNPYDKHTFKCELLTGTHFLPVVNLLSPIAKIDTAVGDDNCVSWTEIFGTGEAHSRASYSPFIGTEMHQGGIPLTEILQHGSMETISIIFRPEEHKFYDLTSVLNDTTMITFVKEKDTKVAKKPIDDPLELTADKINRKLCKSKDCPAAIKFKEYGIGPLATGKGLGTLYGHVEPPAEYGLSHTYGTMSNYGPFGVFSKPKSPDQPFVPSKNVEETKLPSKPNKKYCKFCSERLKRGDPSSNQSVIEDAAEVNKKNLKKDISDVLRLRGGGPGLNQFLEPITKNFDPRKVSESNQRWSGTPRLRAGGPLEGEGLKSPIKECKDVMDKFDEILVAYKKALGPCGQATCPNAPSIIQERCRSVCGKGESIPSGKTQSRLCETPCDFTGGFPACRDPKCAYAKYKLDLVDDDAALELQFLPPAVSGKCGHPKCPYPIQSNLPPIHWDCPEPLPKGACKNLNCPFQPPDLKKLQCPARKPGPCGSPDCPYALPPPCGLPTCPFRPKPTCPFLEKQQTSCFQPEEEEEDNVCENPECPFANEKISASESFDDPNLKGHFIDCANPKCPFATKGKRRPKAKSDNINICGKASCPFANVRKQKVCSNPHCPFATKETKQNEPCGEPRKPSPKIPKFETSTPNKSSLGKTNQRNVFELSDHDLSLNERQNTNSNSKASDVCDNPKCPSGDKTNNHSDQEEEEKCSKNSADCNVNDKICENPECPYVEEAKEASICNIPDYTYVKPCPSCEMPDGPHEPVPQDSKKQSISKKSESSNNQLNVALMETVITQVAKGIDGEEGGGDGNANTGGTGRKKSSKKRRKKRSKFVYSMGNQYPGVKVGHKECVTPTFKVPPKMGWLWNIPMEVMSMKPRRGWKPGAIQKDIAARIRAHREAKGLGILRLPKFKKAGSGYPVDEDDVLVTPKPTLQIQKKDGAYWITMNPLKDPKTLVDNENPYMECTPMQFKITKNKKKKDEDGSVLCYCGEDESSSSSDSELDIEFTPPAGIIHPERFKKKKNIVHCEVQYDPKDFLPEKPEDHEKKGKKGKKGKKDKGGKKKKK